MQNGIELGVVRIFGFTECDKRDMNRCLHFYYQFIVFIVHNIIYSCSLLCLYIYSIYVLKNDILSDLELEYWMSPMTAAKCSTGWFFVHCFQMKYAHDVGVWLKCTTTFMTIFHLSFSIRIDFVRCHTIAFCSFVLPSNSNKDCGSLRLIYSRHSSQRLSMVFRIDLMFRRTLHRCLPADDVCSTCLRLPHNIKLIWIYFCSRAHSLVPFRFCLFSAFCILFPFYSFALFRIWNVIVADLTAAEYQLTMTCCFSKRQIMPVKWISNPSDEFFRWICTLRWSAILQLKNDELYSKKRRAYLCSAIQSRQFCFNWNSYRTANEKTKDRNPIAEATKINTNRLKLVPQLTAMEISRTLQWKKCTRDSNCICICWPLLLLSGGWEQRRAVEWCPHFSTFNIIESEN